MLRSWSVFKSDSLFCELVQVFFRIIAKVKPTLVATKVDSFSLMIGEDCPIDRFPGNCIDSLDLGS